MNRRSNQRFVIFSNYTTEQVHLRAAQLGADAISDKSTEIDGLLDFLERCPRFLAGPGSARKGRAPLRRDAQDECAARLRITGYRFDQFGFDEAGGLQHRDVVNVLELFDRQRKFRPLDLA